jgi:hypothetical protein
MKGLAAEMGFERSSVEYCGLKINYRQPQYRGRREIEWQVGEENVGWMKYIVEFLAMAALTAVCGVIALIVVCEDECLSSLHELDIAVYHR